MGLEKMAEFFDERVEVYDSHMLNNIESAEEFYSETALALPSGINSLLDLGVGTGLELEYIFRRIPDVNVTAVDIAERMLEALHKKFSKRCVNGQLRIINGNYFDIDLGDKCFDAAVSVESLHHFSYERKELLYKKIYNCLKPGGVFVETDYIADCDETERARREEYTALTGGKDDGGEYHYDLPITAVHEISLLENAGFFVALRRDFGNTAIFVCFRNCDIL